VAESDGGLVGVSFGGRVVSLAASADRLRFTDASLSTTVVVGFVVEVEPAPLSVVAVGGLRAAVLFGAAELLNPGVAVG